MRNSTWNLTRQLVAAAVLTAVAVAAMFAAAGQAEAADLSIYSPYTPQGAVIAACPPREIVVIFIDERATIPARTPYFTCVTGTTLLPGTIPPPPEYCCS